MGSGDKAELSQGVVIPPSLSGDGVLLFGHLGDPGVSLSQIRGDSDDAQDSPVPTRSSLPARLEGKNWENLRKFKCPCPGSLMAAQKDP